MLSGIDPPDKLSHVDEVVDEDVDVVRRSDSDWFSGDYDSQAESYRLLVSKYCEDMLIELWWKDGIHHTRSSHFRRSSGLATLLSVDLVECRPMADFEGAVMGEPGVEKLAHIRKSSLGNAPKLCPTNHEERQVPRDLSSHPLFHLDFSGPFAVL
jgi:hypothetical protein